MDLFTGPHVRSVRFSRALDELDLEAAYHDAPDEWAEAVGRLRAAVGAGRTNLRRLVAARAPGWPEEIERAWQRLVGRSLDGHGFPSSHDGEPAAAFLLRGGERDRALTSIKRHLQQHPREAAAWLILAAMEPARGACRAGFLGAEEAVLRRFDAVDALFEAAEADEHARPERWLLVYAALAGRLPIADVVEAVEAEKLVGRPLGVPGDPVAFAVFLVEAEGLRASDPKLGVDAIEARRRLRKVSAPAFERYLRGR